MSDLIELAGKTVIVTGASSGMGASTARLLHAAGAYPVLAARRADRLAALSEELGGALAVPTDVTDPAQVGELVTATLDRHQRIDGLVNNAGASLHGPLDQVDLAEFGRILQLNVVGLLAVTQAVLPAMREQGFGRIVNISSGTTRRVAVGVGAYASTKAAVNMLSDVMREEFAPDGIARLAAAALDHRDRVRRRHVHARRLAAARHGGPQPRLRGRRDPAAAAHRRGHLRHPARPGAARAGPRTRRRLTLVWIEAGIDVVPRR